MTKSPDFPLDTSFTMNRELSWLAFNRRVLQLALDDAVPLLERFRFVSIFTNNLDEFFMIRVGSLSDLAMISETHIDNKSGMTVREQLEAIFRSMPALYRERDFAFRDVEERLLAQGIRRYTYKDLDDDERKAMNRYFETSVQPLLSPQVVDTHHPFPHIENKALHVAVMMRAKEGVKFGIIPLPKALPRVVFLKKSNTQYILMEDILFQHAEKIFEMYSIVEKSVISVTRNADINPDDEMLDFEEDFRHHMKKILKRRPLLSAVRLEISEGRNRALTEYLCARLNLKKEQVFESTAPLEMSYFEALADQLPEPIVRAASYIPYQPQNPPGYNPAESMLKQAMKRDLLLSFPYDSMEPFLRLIRETAADPHLISIKITLYRLDRMSRLAKYLMDAAENGKDVTVIMELRARFDEQNNIEWAERLEESGCRVIYGFAGYKVHSKVCLITRLERGRPQYITQIGTGNYNERTAKLYTDFSLITASEEIGRDANTFFKNMLISNLNGQYAHMLVAPNWLRDQLFILIDAEIAKAKAGRPCGILIKMNSLTDRNTIDKLSEASQAHVPVRLIIRGICCLTPGIPGKTENITVRSIIGRFLEHSRVYCFGDRDNMRMYISSADLMTRNVERRIEAACPVYDPEIKRRLLHILDTQLLDDVRAWALNPDGSYSLRADGETSFHCQDYFMHEAMMERFSQTPPPAEKKKGWLSSLWTKIFKRPPS